MRSSQKRPFRVFGEHLKSLRESAKESLIEVSCAVEIDEATLKSIESGNELPDEDILILLMNHFDVEDKDAVELWELAGYGKEDTKELNEDLLKQIMMVVPVENKVVYSDTSKVTAGKKGLVINFGIDTGDTSQSVAKVGMSLDQATELVEQITTSIENAKKPRVLKALPAPKQSKKNTK